MIISYSKKIFFIHIPKCGGTTIRKLLSPIDEKFRGNNNISENIDIDHLPLFALKKYFPDIFNQINMLDTYAIVRDPFDRFVSSVSQHLKMYKGKQLKELNYQELITEIQIIIKYLSNYNQDEVLLDKEFIHFQRQFDYLFYKNKQLVKNVFTIEQINTLIEIFEKRLDLEKLENTNNHRNTTLVYRKHYFSKVKIFLKNMQVYNLLKRLPQSVRIRINKYVYNDIKIIRNKILKESFVIKFINDYYLKDIEIYNRYRIQ